MATEYVIKEGMLIPEKVNNVRKGNVVMLGGYPCKIVEMKKSKPGKHGAAKTLVVGLDIFTGKKHDEILRGDCQVVVNDKFQLLLLSIDGNQMSCLTDNGDTRSDLNVPEGELGDAIRAAYAAETPINVTVLTALGKELVVSWSEDKA